jgi:hypothetical protein
MSKDLSVEALKSGETVFCSFFWKCGEYKKGESGRVGKV